MRVVLTGAAGQVGEAVRQMAPADVELDALSHAELDISDKARVHDVIRARRPDVIINAAAYTAVDRAESEPAQAQAINADAVGNLAAVAAELQGCRLLHISTDYVFDGLSGDPYLPDSPTRPLNAYGRTKLAGECAVLERLAHRGVVLRTAWVYAPTGKNFALSMLRLMRDHGAVRVVGDQIGSPTAATSIARALWRLAQLPGASGVLHWTDAGSTSWYGFACAIAEYGYAAGLLPAQPHVTRITSADYPTAARRPAHSVLDTRSTAVLLGIEPLPWQETLRATLTAVRERRGR